MKASFSTIEELQQMFTVQQWAEITRKIFMETQETIEEIRRDVMDIDEEQFLQIQLHQFLNEGSLTDEDKRSLLKFIFSLYQDRMSDFGQDLMCDTIMQQNEFGKILGNEKVKDIADVFTTAEFKKIVQDIQKKTEPLPENASLEMRKAHTKKFLDDFMRALFETQ